MQRLVLPLLVGLSYVLAFVQRPGEAVSDTRAELSIDPLLFLERVGSVWSSTTDLGHVQSGQFVGYLFPMGPWFAGWEAVGLPMWISQRLWLGTLMALAAWGVVALMDRLHSPERGPAHLGAAVLFVCNPYVAQYASRGTVTLIAYAALPWLMVGAHLGLREPSRWRWPAAIGLILAAGGGGVNATVIAFALLGPVALMAYEVWVLGIARSAARSFGWRAGLCAVAGSLWWAIPVLLQSRYGADFLSFTEQPGTIWGTTSLSESLRLLGFWVMYAGVGYGSLEPALGLGGTYLFEPAVIVGSFAVPLLAAAGLRLHRDWSYAAFFGLLAVGTLLVMFTGFPEGTPLRKALTFTYNNFASVQFLRTTYKAAPLLALALACLGGAAVGVLWGRACELRLELGGRRIGRWALAPLALVPLAFAFPLFEGQAVDKAVTYGDVPSTWPRALADAERDAPQDSRVMVLPGEQFAFYRWGGTMDPVGPSLTERPLLIREVVPYADARSSQLQETVDDLVQQGRLLPGQLDPLMRLMGVGQVLVASDSRPERSGALDPVAVRRGLLEQPGFARPLASYAPRRALEPGRGRGGAAVSVSDLTRHSVPASERSGRVRVHPAGSATILDGDAHGVAALAAHGAVPRTGALLYGGDLDTRAVRRELRRGASLVFTDSNRRRVVNAARLRARYGPTLAAGDPISADSPTFDLFAGGDDARTVARYDGVGHVRAPLSPGFAIFPEHRPFAALDGDTDTSWLADENLDEAQRYIDVKLEEERPVPTLALLPHADARGRTAAIDLSVNGGAPEQVELKGGWNDVEIRESGVRSLRIRIARVSGVVDEDDRGGGGLAELRIPGVRVSESLRLPLALARGARGADLSSTGMSVLLERTTADFPLRSGADVGDSQARRAIDMVDAEPGIERQLTLPAARSFELTGWASVAPLASDSAIDRLAGVPARWRMDSSSRFEGMPGLRASSAFDRDPATAWAGNLLPGRPAPWLTLRSPRPLKLRRLRISPGGPAYRSPSRVEVSAPGYESGPVDVGADGAIQLPRELRSRQVRVTMVDTAPALRPERGLRAVAVGELRLGSMRPPVPRRRGTLPTSCGALAVSARGERLPAAIGDQLGRLDRGLALRVRGCGRLALPAGPSHLSAPAGEVMRPDHLRLASAPTRAQPPGGAGRVLAQGAGTDGDRDGVRLELDGPAWLVLAESFSDGWRAWCSDERGNERDLGGPVPVDGFANGWRVGADCRGARFEFAPQTLATGSYLASALACLVMLGVLLVAALRDRRQEASSVSSPRWAAPAPDHVVRAGWRAAAVVGVLFAVVGGFMFALRAGLALGPLAALLALWGVSERRLLTLAGASIALLPVIYLAFPPDDEGGFAFEYPVDLLGAHWVAVFGVCCLGAAGVLAAARVRTGTARSSSAGSRSST